MNFETRPKENKQYTTEIHFETVLNQAFANYKKIALYAGLALFVFFFILVIVVSGISANLIGQENINEKSMMQLQKLMTIEPYVWYYIGFSIVLGSLLSPFMASFYKMADAAEKDLPFGVSDLFSYYKPKYFFTIFTTTIIIGLATNGATLIADELGLSFVGILIVLMINFITLFTIPLLIFEDATVFNAVKTSIAIVLKQPMVIFLLVFLSLIGVLLGFFAFCIGIIFTYPFFISMVYAIFKQVTNDVTS
ncbi:hypothetical protein [Flavobacterium sp. LM5]|uniref:hypothetical protein n=1 Tax=Flavobacterium sp. LM5 TaxID=1938610 RepID=UPI00111651AB|nr:hypothetical protein [Flavobacterium sp. LM5]